ncbi:PKD domain-containing protein, partial [Candidatus Poribacteria bacterium]|nr:PKD domain-containing protein [Candidatus Poribacteria bacterium]MBT5535506.1 PKD domain-containing protein [Candidatus Poribacteria bacterium]
MPISPHGESSMAGYGALPRSCPRTLRVATAFVGATTRTAWFWGTVSLLSTLGPAMVVIAATLAVSPASGTPGQTMLTINGSGFPPGNVTLTIRDDSATAGSGLLVGGNGTTNATVDGVLSPAFQAILNPGVSNGRKKIDALDGALNVIASVDFLVGVESRLTVRNGADEISQGTVGTLLTVAPSVATFGASENVEVFFANQSIILQQAINGTFTTNFAVPLMPGGPKQIRAVGRTTGRTLTANFQLIPNITSISESLFDLGETLTITGSGAGAGDSLQVMLATAKDDSPLEDAVVDTSAPVTITAGGAADTSGIFQLTFRVDNRIFDKDRTQVRLRVISVSAGVESAWFGKDSEIPGGLEIITKGVRLTLNQTSGAGDATLTVTGFAADDSGNARLSANIGSVTVQHQFVSSGQRVVVPSSDLTVNVGLKEGDTVRTDFSGKFEVTFPIGTASQPKPGGLLTVSISGENVNYTITPQLRVTDSGGVPRSWVRPGSGFTLEGTGYFPLQNVVATFDGSPLQTSSTPRTDTFGRFTTTFGVSESIPRGTYMLRGADPFSSASITLQLLEGVNSPPVAAAGDNISAYEGGETAFDGSSSTDDTGVVGYAWDFGDGTTAEGVAATHVYSTLGTYIVTLTVVDSDGEMDTDQVAVTVVPPFTFRRHWVFDPAPGGDGNRTATRGERVTAQVRLLNAAWPLGQDVRVALMLVSPWTVVTRHTVTHAAWSIGEARTSGFRVELADDAPPTDIGGIIEIASADGRSWTLPVTFTISRAPVTFDLVDDWLFDPEPGGNRDGQANPGESLRPRIRLSHVGSEDGADVRVSMRTDDPDLTLVISEVTHLSWPAGASRNNDGLLMSVSPTAITHDAVVTVEVCAEGVPTQTFTLTIPIIAPPMPMAKRNAWIYDPPPHGNLDGVANAGETVQPRIRLKLGGVETLRNVRVSLLVTDPDIAVGVGEVVHDVWSPGEARNNDGLLLSIAPNATAHDLHIPVRVTADGRDPWETVLNLRIAESPIAFESRRAWVFDPDGNRDGLAQPGERIRPRFRIKHVGESAAHNVQVTLTSDDPRITIAQGVLRHSVWPAGEGRNSDGVEIDVSPSAPARDVLFTAHVTADNGGSWEFTFTLPIAPQFALRNAWIYDPPPRGNGDGVANAGETVQPRIRLRNDGPETLRNVRVSLLSGASDITAQTGEVVHDVWAPGEAKNSNGLMLAIARGATARDVQMPVRVTADGREPWETILAFSIEESPLRFESRTAWSFDAEPGGNRDGIAQAGERVAPRFRMRHAGESDAHNVTVEITTSDDVVRIVQSEVRHATWPAGAARNNVGLV